MDETTDADTTSPVRDALPTFTAPRGAITAAGGVCAPMAPLYGFQGTPYVGPIAPLDRRARWRQARRNLRNRATLKLVTLAHKLDGTTCYDEDY
jgi:hypothetical protein